MPVIAFLAAVAYVPWLYSGPTVLRWAIIAVGVPLVSRLDPRSVSLEPLLLLAAFVVWAAFGLIFVNDLEAGAWDLAHLLMLGMVFVAAAELDDIDLTMAAFALGIACSEIAQAAQMGGWDGLPRWGGGLPGLFYNREAMALAAAPVAVFVTLRRWWGLSAMAIAAVVLSGSRLGMLATAIGMVMGLRREAARWAVGVAIVATGIASLTLFGDSRVASAAQRLAIWNDALSGITPLGHGLGSWIATYPAAEFAHSDLLQAGYETGIVGVALLVRFWWLAITESKADAAILGAFLAVTVTAAVSFPLHLPASGFMAAVVAGHMVRRRAVVCGSEPVGRSAGHDHAIADGGA